MKVLDNGHIDARLVDSKAAQKVVQGVATSHFNVHPRSSIKLDDISKNYVSWSTLNKNSNHRVITAQLTLNLCYAVPGVVTMYQPPRDVDHYDDTVHDYSYLCYSTIFL
jgi:hypothetical protein